MDISSVIRDIPDFPKPGVLFRDITPVLHNPEVYADAVEQMVKKLEGLDFDYIAGPESRGFLFGVPIALRLGKGFIPVRKAGKLPYKTVGRAYALEYGEAVIEIHEDAMGKGDRIVVVDDLLATGGTCHALCKLVEEVGGSVEALVFLIELKDLGGRALLDGYNVKSIIEY